MNERYVAPDVPKRRKCNFFPGDIVRHADRPDNPCEVFSTCELPHRDWVMFLMDKRTLKGSFVYDDDDKIELVRRPSPDLRTALDRPVRAGDVRPKGTSTGRRPVHR